MRNYNLTRCLCLFPALLLTLQTQAQKKSLAAIEDETTHLYGIGYYGKDDKPVFVVPARYTYASNGSSYNGKDEFFVARVSPGNLPRDSMKDYVVFDRTGKQTATFRATGFFTDWFPYIGIELDRLVGLLDHTGAVLIPPVYRTISPEYAPCSDPYCPLLFFVVATDEVPFKWGLLDAQGKVKLEFTWNELYASTVKGWLVASRNGRFGWIDPSGKEQIPLQFDEVHDFNAIRDVQKKQYAEVAKKNAEGVLQWGLIDVTGKEVVPCVHISAEVARVALK